VQVEERGTPVPGWMITNDDGGDLLHIGVKTTDS